MQGKNNRKILVTGSKGFIGSYLCEELKKLELTIIKISRSDLASSNNTIDGNTDWSQYLSGVDCVIHTAAKAHITKKDKSNFYQEINFHGTANLAKQASKSGVRRFIFISSAKVHGEKNRGKIPFTEDDNFFSEDAYAKSKFETEVELNKIALSSDMEVVIIRPPLVYGKNVKANFYSLIKIVSKGIPLPVLGFENKRSFIAIENLVNFIITSIDHSKAANEVFLISDDNDISVKEVIKKIAEIRKKRIIIFYIPYPILYFFCKLFFLSSNLNKVYDNFQIDISKAKEKLSWTPIVNMDESLKNFLSNYR